MVHLQLKSGTQQAQNRRDNIRWPWYKLEKNESQPSHHDWLACEASKFVQRKNIGKKLLELVVVGILFFFSLETYDMSKRVATGNCRGSLCFDIGDSLTLLLSSFYFNRHTHYLRKTLNIILVKNYELSFICHNWKLFLLIKLMIKVFLKLNQREYAAFKREIICMLI
jgi:hypothetical protein